MTIKAIQALADEQNQIHDAAKRIVEMLDAAKAEVDRLGGDGDAARDRILELVSED
jgi:hypothetical protein